MTSLLDLIQLVSSAAANILISGESGTGKELVAQAIHFSGSRKDKPFIALNCAAIPEQLLESELFGHVKGAFTGATSDKKGLFEEADGGTLFLDEIGDLSLPLQAKVLRVLQEKQIRAVGGSKLKSLNIRIITASHRDIKEMTQVGSFREDLFYRLNVIPVRVPALRERTEDIPLLVENFIKKFSAANKSPAHRLTAEAMALLIAHPWPGNVRELENVVERAMVLSPGEVIEASNLFEIIPNESQFPVQELQADRPTLEKLEERYIKLTLDEVHNRKDEAARILGISRRTLYRKELSYGSSTELPAPTIEASHETGH